MTVTATLVHVGHDSLRYLLEYDAQAGTTATITTTGAATPDVLTDSVQGPLKALAKAFTDGYGAFAAGALTQAQARALWLSDYTSDPASGDPAGSLSRIRTATCQVVPRANVSNDFKIDADVDGSGHPTITIATAGSGAADAYLDVKLDNAIGA